MPTSAAGNKPCDRAVRGFTLIELMVVVALMALATAGISLSLRDSADSALERDAQRLAAVLESARAQARASDAYVVWQPREGGFALQGLPVPAQAQTWLSDQTRAQVAAPFVLGPEPLIAPQQIALFSAQQPQRRLWVATDGLRPFEVRRTAGATPP